MVAVVGSLWLLWPATVAALSLSFASRVPPPRCELSAAPSDAALSLATKDQFAWTKQWYPVAATEFLDATRPHAFTLLGRDVVLWNDGPSDAKGAKTPGTWRCFEDACPHRLAPLSEGRVEATGELLCAYHAWRFDGSGSCTAIPQSPPDLEAQHCASPKAGCGAMPTREADGLLWVWPETGANAPLEAALRSPALIPELHDEALAGRVKQLPWNVRELPYGWDMFMENVMDPAHVSVAHHGITGNRYTGALPIALVSERAVSTQGGFKFRVQPDDSLLGRPEVEASPIESSTNDFVPPSLLQIRTLFKSGAQQHLVLYATPTKPGYCRHIGCQVLVADEQGKTPSFLKLFTMPMPTWMLHILASVFLHQDMVFLHHQEKILADRGYKAQPGGGDYVSATYSPNQMDKNVITFRQWLRTRAGGGVPWPEGRDVLPPRATDDQLFDVYHSHVKDCVYCQAALKNLKRGRLAAFVAAAAFVLARPAIGLGAAAGGAAAAASAGGLMGKLIGLFYVYRFRHSDND